MSRNESCFNGFKEKVKEFFSDEEASALFDQLESELDRRQEQSGESVEDVLDKFAKRVKNAQDREKIIRERNKLLNLNKFHDNLERINRFKDPSNGMRSFLVGKQAYVKEAMRSVDSIKKSTRSAFARRIIEGLKRENVFETFNDKTNGVELAKEMFEEGSSKDENIRKVAKVVKKVTEQSVKLLNDAGADIQILKGFIANTTHNPELIQQTAESWRGRQEMRIKSFQQFGKDFEGAKKFLNDTAYDRWANFITPLIDMEGLSDLDLRELWNDFAKGVHLKAGLGDEFLSFKKSKISDLGKRISQHRIIRFKDGESWAKYNESYGSGSVHLAIMNTLLNNADNLSILRMLGTQPEDMFENLKKRVIADSEDPKIKQKMNKTDKLFKEVIGQANQPISHLGAKIGAAARALESTAKLTAVVLASIPDLATNAALFRTRGDNLFAAWGEVFQNFAPKTAEERAIQDATGTWAESTFYHLTSHFAPQDVSGGFTSKAMQTLFKVVGMEWWDKSMRTGVGQALSRRLAQFRDLKFDALAPGEKRSLELYGIDEKEWDLIRKNRGAMKQAKNKMYIVPDGVFEYSPESIAEYLGKTPESLTDFDIRKVQTDISERLQNYFIDQTDFANIQPGAADRATLLGATQPGTYQGELMRMFSQFKYFPVGFTRKIFGRALLGHGDDNIVGSLLSGNHDVLGLVETMISATLLGYAAVTLKDLSRGREPRSPLNTSVILESLLQGGGLGLYGDFIFGEWNKFGHSLIEGAGGPVVGTLDDMARLFAEIRTMDGNPKASAFHLVKNNFPFLNIWYTRFAVNYLFLYALQERYSPGSTQRQVDKLEREKDQQFLISPLSALGV